MVVAQLVEQLVEHQRSAVWIQSSGCSTYYQLYYKLYWKNEHKEKVAGKDPINLFYIKDEMID